MSILSVNSIENASPVAWSSTVQDIYTGLVRKWVEFNGGGTVSFRNAYGVSSVGDNGVGSYQVNFSGNMPTASYVVFGTAVGSTTPSDRGSITTSLGNTKQVNYCRLEFRNTGNNSQVDADHIGVGFIGTP